MVKLTKGLLGSINDCEKHKQYFSSIIDYNKIQSYVRTKDVLDLEPLKDKLTSFDTNRAG